MSARAKNTVCLWYDDDAEEAANFYAKTFPDSSVGQVDRAPADYPAGKEGDPIEARASGVGNNACIARARALKSPNAKSRRSPSS